MRAAAREHRKTKRAGAALIRSTDLVGASGHRRWNQTFYRKHRSEEYARTLAYDRAHPKAKRGRQSRAARKMRDTLSDGYVRWGLSRGSSVKMSEWPDVLVELKRAQLQCLRLCKSHKT